MLQFMENEIYGNVLTLWGLSLLVGFTLLFVALGTKLFLLHRLPPAGPTEDLHWRAVLRELVEKTWTLFITIAAFYAGALVLELPRPIEEFVFSVFIVALFIQIAFWADRIVSAGLAWRFAPRRAKAGMRNAVSVIQFIVRVGVWTLALLLIFENLGINVTALVAGLGIGGIAVALAAQNILGDLFSSLAIVLDRPFEVGDFIVFGQQSGTVERIGIKTTRLRSLSGEQIVCANSDLLGSRIHNFKRMAERRVVFRLSPAYETPIDKLEQIPAQIEEIIEDQSLTRFERAHFLGFGDSALIFEVVYWVLTPDHNSYMDIHQAVNFAIMRKFQEKKVEFAYPTQTLYVPALKEALSTGASQPQRDRLPRSIRAE
jgi:small-conductance mechanosensitive channel